MANFNLNRIFIQLFYKGIKSIFEIWILLTTRRIGRTAIKKHPERFVHAARYILVQVRLDGIGRVEDHAPHPGRIIPHHRLSQTSPIRHSKQVPLFDA